MFGDRKCEYLALSDLYYNMIIMNYILLYNVFEIGGSGIWRIRYVSNVYQKLFEKAVLLPYNLFVIRTNTDENQTLDHIQISFVFPSHFGELPRHLLSQILRDIYVNSELLSNKLPQIMHAPCAQRTPLLCQYVL